MDLENARRSASTLELARLLMGVPEDVRQMLVHGAQPILLRKGASLFEKGDKGGIMYVVQDGRIEISFIIEAGRKIVLNHVGPVTAWVRSA